MTVTPPDRDLTGRPLQLRNVDWHSLFSPGRVAFVGATDREGSQQRAQWIFLRDRLVPRGCEVIPVHPTKKDVLGTPAVRSVLDIDGDVDIAVIIVRDPLPALRECVQKGVRFVIVFSAGFAELGTAEGRQAEAALSALAQQGNTRVIGPNTNLNIFEPWRTDLPGRRLAIVTQSGFQGRPISQGQKYGIPILSWATLGNEADLEWADFVNHYVGAPEVGAVATYVEGFKDGRTLMLAADAAARNRVPIVAIKVGRSQEGRAMALAHTGHLTGSDLVYDAAFEQAGLVRVDDLDEAIEISGMFCHVPELTGNDGLALYTLSGGTAAHLADLCGAAGIAVPRFADRTVKALADHVPGILRMDNPLDSGGTLTVTPSGRATLDIVMDDENTNVLMVPITGVFPGMIEPLAHDLAELHEQQRQPILVVWASPERDNDGYRLLCERGVPLFHSLSSAVRGAAELFRRRRFVATYESPFARLPRVPTERSESARATLRSTRPLDEVESKALLRNYGIPVVADRVVSSPQDAVRAVESLDCTAVLKILSPDITHKSDLGLVRVGITQATAADAYRQLVDTAIQRAPDAEVRGVLVQPMVTGAVAEVILGLSQQEPFGAVVMFGLGGVFAEVFEDIAFGVPPFTRAWAERMVARIKAAPLLTGARGRPAGDVPALVDAVLNLQRLATEAGDQVAELDINPLMVLPAGQGVVAVDALVVPRGGLAPQQ
jgi:acyl-CoA synthetase (NDP forming)